MKSTIDEKIESLAKLLTKDELIEIIDYIDLILDKRKQMEGNYGSQEENGFYTGSEFIA